MKAALDEAGMVEQDAALRQAAGQAFYNASRFTLRDLRFMLSNPPYGKSCLPPARKRPCGQDCVPTACEDGRYRRRAGSREHRQ